jgi:hypothetical protein
METVRPTWGAHLVVRSPNATGRTTRVWLNGQEISRCLQSVVLTITGDDVTKAVLTIGVDRVEIDAQTLAALQALVESDEKEVPDGE